VIRTYRSCIVLGYILSRICTGAHVLAISDIVSDTHVPEVIVRNVIESLADCGILSLQGSNIIVKVKDCVDALFKLLEGNLLKDIEFLCDFIPWNVFEEVVCRICRVCNYETIRRLRIPTRYGREEIDVIAIKDNIMLFIEVKHYKKARLKLEDVVRIHVEKVKKCVESREELLKRVPVKCMFSCYVIPVVVTLRDYGVKVLDDVPIVPIYRLRSFLCDVITYVDSLAHFIL